jgi:hypothetical protein
MPRAVPSGDAIETALRERGQSDPVPLRSSPLATATEASVKTPESTSMPSRRASSSGCTPAP